MHDFESEPVPKHVVRLRRSSAEAKTKLFDVVSNTKYLDGGKSVFGHVVEEMTSMVRLEGPVLLMLTSVRSPRTSALAANRMAGHQDS